MRLLFHVISIVALVAASQIPSLARTHADPKSPYALTPQRPRRIASRPTNVPRTIINNFFVQPAPPPAPQMRNGLPPCTMDSFVYEAAEHADHIYGDEGVVGLPPYSGFNVASRINTGILDVRDQGLTTGHGTSLPDAWGGDEWTGNEWSKSGSDGLKESQGFPEGLPNLTQGSGFTWGGQPGASPQGQQIGYAPIYGQGNFNQPATSNNPIPMTAADLAATQQSLNDFSFFGTPGHYPK